MHKKERLDGERYKRSLESKDPTHRFYDRLRSDNMVYYESGIHKILIKWRTKKRAWIHKRSIKKMERNNKYAKL